MIVAQGNCVMCNKPIDRDSIYLCQACYDKTHEQELNGEEEAMSVCKIVGEELNNGDKSTKSV